MTVDEGWEVYLTVPSSLPPGNFPVALAVKGPFFSGWTEAASRGISPGSCHRQGSHWREHVSGRRLRAAPESQLFVVPQTLNVAEILSESNDGQRGNLSTFFCIDRVRSFCRTLANCTTDRAAHSSRPGLDNYYWCLPTCWTLQQHALPLSADPRRLCSHVSALRRLNISGWANGHKWYRRKLISCLWTVMIWTFQ